MDTRPVGNPSNTPAITVLITDSALELLAFYCQQATENACRVDSLVNSLKRADMQGRVVKFSGAERPVWQCDVDAANCIYVTIGRGPDECVEARIAFFGPPLPNNEQSYKEILFLAGEVPFYAIPDHIVVQDERTDVRLPPSPQRTLEGAPTLDKYLEPDELELLETYLHERPMDDLNGRPYRLLHAVGPPVDLPARLSPQQKEKLTKPRPMFLQGVAGSGKTTLLTHFAHQEMVRTRDASTILIIAYTESLKRFVERLLVSLRRSELVDLTRVEVFTWRELCDMAAGQIGLNAIQWAPESQFANFASGALRRPMCANDTHIDLVPELQEFIRSTLKGDTVEPDRALIRKDTFLSMSNVAIDRFIKRKEVYDIAERYQYFLEGQGLSDDLDAARDLLRYRDGLPKYDYVLVDEAQDYAFVQLRMMAALSRTPSGLFYAGDMNQVVYPSQFNWEKARSAVYHVWTLTPPPVEVLDYNYRNPQPVSNMANSLMQIRSKRLGSDHVITARSNQATTPMPLRIRLGRNETTKIIRDLAVKIGSLGIVQETEHHLDIERIEFQRTFTPQSVKGLEFNVVCLVGFNALYRQLTAKGRRRLTPRQLLLKFNEVYVSITRTRGQLLLIDGEVEGEKLWDAAEMLDFINVVETPAEVIKLVADRYLLSTRDEWRVSALDFEGQQAYASAGECWERAGVPENAAIAYERAGRLLKAQTIYKMLGKLAEAARLAEEQKDFKGAARLYESDAQWAVAATCWVRGENYASAAKAYQRAAEVHDSADLWTKAATYYARSKSYGDAAGCYERAADWQRGAESWVALGSLLDAARCYEKAGARDKARDCIAKQHEKNGDFAAAGDAWELLHKWADAARCWEKAGGLQRAQKLYVDAGMPLDSVRLLAALGEHVKAASQYENLRMFDHAAKHYEKAGEWSAAARCWNVIRAWRQEIVCYEKARDWENVGRIRTRDGKHRKAAVAYEQWQRFDLAAASWIAADDFRRAAKAYERAEDWVSAAKQWKRVGSIADVRRCLFTGGAENLLTEIMEKQLLSHVSAESAEITESKIAAASDVSDDKAVYLAPLAPPEGGTDERTAETSFELNTPLAGEDLAPAVFREPTAYAEASATTSAVVDELRQGASTEDVDPRTESRTVTSRTLFKRIRTFIRSVLERH